MVAGGARHAVLCSRGVGQQHRAPALLPVLFEIAVQEWGRGGEGKRHDLEAVGRRRMKDAEARTAMSISVYCASTSHCSNAVAPRPLYTPAPWPGPPAAPPLACKQPASRPAL